MFKLPETALISHASKIMLKILQAKLQQYVNQDLPDIQAVLRKHRGTRNQISNICWIIEKAREFQKSIYFYSSTMLKPLTVWIITNLKTVKEMGILDHLICPLRNLYAGQEAIVRTRDGRIDWFRIEKSMTMLYCHPAYLTYMQST